MTSLVALSGSLTGAGVSNGALYVSSSQQVKPLYAQCQASPSSSCTAFRLKVTQPTYLGKSAGLHLGKHRFRERLVVSSAHISNVLLLSMRCVRDKVPLSDIDACKALNVNTGQLRKIHHSAESNFITWFKDGSPDITTENLRDVTRMTDARGKQFLKTSMFLPLISLPPLKRCAKRKALNRFPKTKGKSFYWAANSAKWISGKTFPQQDTTRICVSGSLSLTFPESTYNPYPQSLHRASQHGPQMISPGSVKVR